MGGWDQNGRWGDFLGGEVCGVDSRGSGYEPVAGFCEHCDEPSGSGSTELITFIRTLTTVLTYEFIHYFHLFTKAFNHNFSTLFHGA
jgi:hypothetical protein